MSHAEVLGSDATNQLPTPRPFHCTTPNVVSGYALAGPRGGAAPSEGDTGAIPALGSNCAERKVARGAAAIGSRRGGDGAAEERRASERRHENGLQTVGRPPGRLVLVSTNRAITCYQRAYLTEDVYLAQITGAAEIGQRLRETFLPAGSYIGRIARDGATEIEETHS